MKGKVRVNLSLCLINYNVRWVPCHHGTARPQVADGGDAV
jgi:hypothetical protein